MHFFCTQLRKHFSEIAFFCDGDDTLIFTPGANISRLRRVLPEVASNLALDVRVEGVYSQLTDVEFCQHRGYYGELIPDPCRAYVKLSAAVVATDTPEARARAREHKLAAVAAYLAKFPNMPLIRVLAPHIKQLRPSEQALEIAERYSEDCCFPDWDALFPQYDFVRLEAAIDETVTGSDC